MGESIAWIGPCRTKSKWAKQFRRKDFFSAAQPHKEARFWQHVSLFEPFETTAAAGVGQSEKVMMVRACYTE
jgi:hypothetical protein